MILETQWFYKIPWPHLLEWVYNYLPLIDEHNKQWQSSLWLEKKWPTKNCWFHLLITVVGMSAVDLHHIYLNHNKHQFGKMDIIQFTEEICLNLWERDEWRANQPEDVIRSTCSTSGQDIRLKWIRVGDGFACWPWSLALQTKHGQTNDPAITANCYISWKYIVKKGKTKLCLHVILPYWLQNALVFVGLVIKYKGAFMLYGAQDQWWSRCCM